MPAIPLTETNNKQTGATPPFGVDSLTTFAHMNPKIQEITIDGQVYVPKSSLREPCVVEGLPCVLIRTYSAGVHIGFLKSRNGKEVELVKARRLWKWSGAFTLSEIAETGVSDPSNCKFSVEVGSIVLTEAVEVIAVTTVGQKSVYDVKPCKV